MTSVFDRWWEQGVLCVLETRLILIYIELSPFKWCHYSPSEECRIAHGCLDFSITLITTATKKLILWDFDRRVPRSPWQTASFPSLSDSVNRSQSHQEDEKNRYNCPHMNCFQYENMIQPKNLNSGVTRALSWRDRTNLNPSVRRPSLTTEVI